MERKRRVDSERNKLLPKITPQNFSMPGEESSHKRKMNDRREMNLSNKKTKSEHICNTNIECKYDNLSQVGNDMIYHILEFLDWRFRVQVCMRVSKQWFELVSNSIVHEF